MLSVKNKEILVTSITQIIPLFDSLGFSCLCERVPLERNKILSNYIGEIVVYVL